MLTGRALIALGLTNGKAFLAKSVARTKQIRHGAGSAASKFANWFSTGAAQAKASAAKIRSDRLQDRMAATGTFAAIALFAAMSADALLGGGLELGARAEAAQPAPRFVVLAALPDIPYRPPAAYVTALPDNARVVAVSYSPAAEQLLGGPIAGEEREAVAEGADTLELATEDDDAPVKIEAPRPAEIVKTVPF